jgi:hypothetical protein
MKVQVYTVYLTTSNGITPNYLKQYLEADLTRRGYGNLIVRVEEITQVPTSEPSSQESTTNAIQECLGKILNELTEFGALYKRNHGG